MGLGLRRGFSPLASGPTPCNRRVATSFFGGAAFAFPLAFNACGAKDGKDLGVGGGGG